LSWDELELNLLEALLDSTEGVGAKWLSGKECLFLEGPGLESHQTSPNLTSSSRLPACNLCTTLKILMHY